MSRRHRVPPYWKNNPPKIIPKSSVPPIQPVAMTQDIAITDKTISFVGPAMDCCVEKCVREYVHLFDKDGYQIIFTPQAKIQEIIRYVPRSVVLFRVGTNPLFMQEVGISNISKLIAHLRGLGVRIVYYIDDLLIHANNRAPISIASQCDAILVATSELYDLFSDIKEIKAPIIHVPTHIYLDLFDTLPVVPHIKSIPRYKVLLTSSGRMGAKYLHDICEKANANAKEFSDIEWIINAASVAEMRTLINGFRNLHKTYIDWLPLNDFYSLCKSVDIIINPATPEDLFGVVPPEWQESWLNAKSAVKYTLAGAARIPVISSPMRSYKEAIHDGETGVIANSVDEFIEKIQFFKANLEAATKIGEAARKDIEVNYNITERYPLYRDAIIGQGSYSSANTTIPQKSYLVGKDSEEMPVASIVVLSYNQDKYLPDAIESAINQDFDQPFEVIVVDDGSTDNSVAIAKKYDKVSVLAMPANTNSWCAAPLNYATGMSRGKYIGHVASDDVLHSNYLSSTIPIFEADPNIGFVRIGMREIGEGFISGFSYPIITNPSQINKTILEYNLVFGSSPHTKAAWDAIGGYRPFYLQDWDFWIRLIWAGFSMATCQKILYTYRVHGQSLSNQARQGILTKEKNESLLMMAKSHEDKLIQMNIAKGELYAVLAAQKSDK